jgi:hypothetical protein
MFSAAASTLFFDLFLGIGEIHFFFQALREGLGQLYFALGKAIHFNFREV